MGLCDYENASPLFSWLFPIIALRRTAEGGYLQSPIYYLLSAREARGAGWALARDHGNSRNPPGMAPLAEHGTNESRTNCCRRPRRRCRRIWPQSRCYAPFSVGLQCPAAGGFPCPAMRRKPDRVDATALLRARHVSHPKPGQASIAARRFSARRVPWSRVSADAAGRLVRGWILNAEAQRRRERRDFWELGRAAAKADISYLQSPIYYLLSAREARCGGFSVSPQAGFRVRRAEKTRQG